jgi:hypothetical protein
VIVRVKLKLRVDFLNPGCGFEEFLKTVFRVALDVPGFPRLPQAVKIGLCKA